MVSRGLIVGSFTALMLFMLSFSAANGLTCYKCSYDTSTTTAGKQFCNATLQVCNEQKNETYCGESFVQRSDGSTVFQKGCAENKLCLRDLHKVCEDYKKEEGFKECSLKCCQGDRCNSAFVTTTISTTVLVFGLALVFFTLL